MSDDPTFRAFLDNFRWEGVEQRAYKEEGAAPFKAVTRQVLFKDPDLECELRYFEVAPGGHTTLERHEHIHAVMILRGSGRCLVGTEVRAVKERDLVTVPPLAWHQLRAGDKEPLGFLCMVNAARDRPQLPDETELETLKADPRVAEFLR
jgi:quercetin dioxygenase-like cupin family protein